MICVCMHEVWQHYAVPDPDVSGLAGSCMWKSCDCQQFEQSVEKKGSK